MFFCESLIRSSVIGCEEKTLAIVPGFFFSIDWIFSKKSTNAVGSYPALYIYCRPSRSASCSNDRENFEESDRNQNAGGLPNTVSGPAAHKDQRDRTRG